jgi:hypothetical protein
MFSIENNMRVRVQTAHKDDFIEACEDEGCCVYVCIGDDSTVLLDLHTGGCDPEGVADLLRTLAERFN